MDTIHIGIDPGASGCVVAIHFREMSLVDPIKIYYLDYKTSNPSQMYFWFRDLEELGTIKGVMIERVHALFGSSAKSTFNFGFNVGVMHTVANVLQLPIYEVDPVKWQEHIRIPKKLDKNDRKKLIAGRMLEIYPKEEPNLYTPRLRLIDGRSDALAIAHYFKENEVQVCTSPCNRKR